MIKELKSILEKTYDNPILRRTTVPTFFTSPGYGKSSIVKEFAESRGVNMIKMTLSQLMPNEIGGLLFPDPNTQKLVAYDSHILSNMKDMDILFLDEVFNGTLKATLDAVLNLLEDRMLPSGRKLADVMVVAAANPQGLITITPQIKQRFIRYDLKFNPEEFQEYLKDKYGMPTNISTHLSTLVNKEKFDSETWNYFSPRSIEKSINQIGVDLSSPLEEVLIPYLSKEIISPVDINSLGIKQNDSIPYLTLLKHIIKEMNKSKQK